MIDGLDLPGLGKDVIHYGKNSGYQAINLAYLWGAERILLLGYDMQATKKMHFFGDHPSHLCNGPNFGSIVPLFKQLAADLDSEGVEVLNCSRETALPYFKRANLEDALALS